MAMLGVWMWAQSVQQHGAAKAVSYCSRAGITDIFFLTKGLSGTTAHLGAYAPHTSERDLLQELITAAHNKGIRVHAWFTSACDEYYKQLYPESGRCHFVRGKDRELISLTDEGYLAYMELITRELCRNYEIDGLHLDYIRYNHLVYGWADEDLVRYSAEGADVKQLKNMMQRMFLNDPKDENLLFEAYRNGDESTLALARARRKDVVRFAKTLTELARAEKSSMILSAALMPEGAYDDIAFADLHYGQNYEDAAGLYDYALPMAYSTAYEKDAEWVRKVAEGTIRKGLKTIIGLHAYEGGTGLSLQADIAALRTTPVQGICLFREGAFAMVYASKKELSVYNPTADTITHIIAGNNERTLQLEGTIQSGEEKQFRIPFEVQTIRVFANEKELCAFLT